MSDHLTSRAGLLTARIADRCSDDDLRNDLTGLSKDLTTESLQIDHNDRIARVVDAFGLTPFAVDLLIMVGLPDEHGLLTRWARLTHPARLPFVTPAAIADALGLDAAGRRHLRAEVDGGALRRTGLI